MDVRILLTPACRGVSKYVDTPCRGIIYYARTFRKKRIALIFRYLCVPPWRARDVSLF